MHILALAMLLILAACVVATAQTSLPGTAPLTLQGDLAAWFGSVPSVQAACKGNALLTDSGCSTNGFDNFEKIWFWRTPTAKCEQEGTCVPYSQWAKDYIAILGK